MHVLWKNSSSEIPFWMHCRQGDDVRIVIHVESWFISIKFSGFWKSKVYLWSGDPSRQILLPRLSWGRPPPTSPGHPLKIRFEHPEDVLVWRPENIPIWRPGDVLKWQPGDALIWRSRDVPGRLIRVVTRMFTGRPLEHFRSTQIWMFQNSF